MDIIMPAYYPQFHCIAAACPDSCCKEWAVQIDADAAAYYCSLPGALGDALRESLQEEDGDTILALRADGRCPMWRDDGLCRIQAELGEAALCHTCRDFPRLRHDYGSFVEVGLELSCPEAARLILSDMKHETIVQTQPGGEAPEYDQDTMDILLRSRKEVLSVLADHAYTVGEGLKILLLHAHEVQAQIDGGEAAVFAPAQYLERSFPAVSSSMQPIFDFFGQLEILTPQWRDRLLAAPVDAQWNDAHRALAIYMVQRYWLQAVADLDLVCRAKLAVIACLLVKALGGDTLQTAQLFSKEIENDPDNVEAILDGAYTSPALTDLALLNLLTE